MLISNDEIRELQRLVSDQAAAIVAIAESWIEAQRRIRAGEILAEQREAKHSAREVQLQAELEAERKARRIIDQRLQLHRVALGFLAFLFVLMTILSFANPR